MVPTPVSAVAYEYYLLRPFPSLVFGSCSHESQMQTHTIHLSPAMRVGLCWALVGPRSTVFRVRSQLETGLALFRCSGRRARDS